MKILFVGQLQSPSRSWQRLRAFNELGHVVHAINSAGRTLAPRSPGAILDSILWRLSIARDTTGANAALVDAVNTFKPDIIWVEKGNSIRAATLVRVRASCPGKPLISFSEDDMFAQHNRTRDYTSGMPLYDAVVTTKSYNCRPEELPSLGARKVILVPNTFDARLHRPMSVSEAERDRLGGQVGFIGTYESDRARSLLFLAENGINVRIRGLGGWDALRNRHPNLDVLRQERVGEDYVKAICSTNINLCFLRKLNRDQQTSRSVEIPACGGFMIAERTQEHMTLFAEGREAEFFSSDGELLDKVRYYLSHEDERSEIARNGRIRCEASGYSMQACLAGLLSTLSGLGGDPPLVSRKSMSEV